MQMQELVEAKANQFQTINFRKSMVKMYDLELFGITWTCQDRILRAPEDTSSLLVRK